MTERVDGMWKKIKEMKRMKEAGVYQSVSMKRRLNLYWICMAFAGLAAILLVLSMAGVFSNSAKKVQESLVLQQENNVQELEDHIDSLEAENISLSRSISESVNEILATRGKEFQDIDDDSELILEIEEKAYHLLNTTLKSSKCNGTFFFLNSTCNTKIEGAEDSKAGVYIRYSDLSGVNTSNKHVVYFRGMSDVARNEKIQMHNRWNMEFDSSAIPGMDEILEKPVDRLANSCVWTEMFRLKDTWEDVSLLCVPVLDSEEQVIGICGMEWSGLYFRLSYPATTSPYGNILTVMAPIEDNEIFLDKAMTGTSDGISLESAGTLKVKEGKYYNKYVGGEQRYIGNHEVMEKKLLNGQDIAIVTLITEDSFEKVEMIERIVWIFGLFVFLIAMLLISKILAGHFTAPICEVFEKVKKEDSNSDQKSGILEIDELMEYVRDKIQNSSDQELPPNIEELFHTFTARVNTLTPMEHTVLEYYIEGYSVEEVAQKSFISVNTAKKHNTNINRKLGVTSRDELMLYIDLYRRCGKIDEISNHTKI